MLSCCLAKWLPGDGVEALKRELLSDLNKLTVERFDTLSQQILGVLVL